MTASDDATRFEVVLAAHGGDGARVVAALERAFAEWTLPPDEPDDDAGARWLALVVAITGAGPRGIAVAPTLLADAAVVLATQVAAIPSELIDDSLRSALDDLATDLADDGDPALATAAATLRAGL